MSVIDNKIVEMQFDNRNFESNVKTSMNTLENLKKQLDMTESTKSLSNLQNAAEKVDFSAMQGALEALQNRFSTFGIVGMTVISNLTSSVMSFVGNVTSSLLNMVKTGGISRAMNIEQAKFQLQGLSVMWTDIKDDIDYAVSGTAYGLDAAAMAASQLVASGVKFGKESDAMKNALRGISGAAAMTNSSYEDMSRIFTTVAGNGRLMGDQLNQLGARGLNAAATLVNYFNKVKDGSIEATDSIKDSIDDIYKWASKQDGWEGILDESILRTAVSKSLVDFELFSTAMDATFGEHAKNANNTFTGVMSNVRAALSKIGAEFATPWIQQNSLYDIEEAATKVTNLVDILNEFRLRINDVKSAMMPMFGPYKEWVGNVSQGVVDLLQSVKLTEQVIDSEGKSITKLTKSGEDLSDIFQNTFSIFEGSLVAISKVLTPIGQGFNEIFGGSILSGVRDFTGLLAEMIPNLWLTQEASENLKSTFAGVFAVIDILKNTVGILMDFTIKPLYMLINTLFGTTLEVTGSIGDTLVGLSRKFREFRETSINVLLDSWLSFLDNLGSSNNIQLPGLDRLKDYLAKIGEYASIAKNKILDMLNNISMGEVSNGVFAVLSSLYKAIQKFGEGVRTLIGGIIDGIKRAFIDAKFDTLTDAFNFTFAVGGMIVLRDMFVWFFDALRTFKLKWDTIFGKNGVIATGFNFISNIELMLGNLRGAILNFSKDLKADMLQKLSTSLLTLAGALFILSLIDSQQLALATVAIGGLMTMLAGCMRVMATVSFGTGGNAGIFSMFADYGKILTTVGVMTGFATSVGILALAMVPISKLDWEALAKGLVGVGTMALIMVATMKSLAASELSNPEKSLKGLSGMISVAIAIRLLASSVEALGDLEWDELAKGLIGATTLIAAMLAFLKVLGKSEYSQSGMFAKTSMTIIPKGLVTSVIAVATSVKIMSSAVSDMGELDVTSLTKGLVSMGAILLGLGAFIKVISSSSFVQSKNMMASTQSIIPPGLAASVIATAASIKIIASAIEELGTLNTESLVKGLVGVGAVLGGMGAILALMPNDATVVKTGATMILMASSLTIVASAIKQIGNLDWGELARGLAGASGAMVVLAGILAILSTISTGVNTASLVETAGSMIIMAAAVRVLAPALSMLGNLSIDQLVTALAALAGAFSILGIAGFALAPLAPILITLSGALARIGAGVALFGAGVSLLGAGLISIAAGLASLAASVTASAGVILYGIKSLILGIISFIPETASALTKAFVSIIESVCIALKDSIPMVIDTLLSVISGALSALNEHAYEIGNTIFDIVIKGLTVLQERLPELIQVFSAILSTIFSEGVANFAALIGGSIGGVLAIEALFSELVLVLIGLAKNAGFIMQGAKVAAIVVGIIAVLSGIVILLKETNAQEAMPSVIGIGLLFAEVSAVIYALRLVPVATATKVALAISAFIGVLSGVVAAAGAIAQIPGAKWLIGEGGGFLQSIGSAIGGFIGGIAGGAIESASNSLPVLGSNLSGFMSNAKSFFDNAKNIDPSISKSIANLSAAMLMLTGSDLIDGIARFITGSSESSLEKFGSQLSSFAPHFNSFYEQVKDIQPDVVQASANAALAMAEFAKKIPNEGGLLAKIVGDNDLASFGEKLAAFGPHIASYSKCISEAKIDEQAVVASANAASVLSEFAKGLPNEGGLLAKIVGDNDLETFGQHISAFAPMLVQYASEVKNIDSDAVIASANAGKILSEFAKEIPQSGGLLQKILGNNDLEKFGKTIVPFAKDISTYSEIVSGNVNEEAVTASANAGKVLAQLVESLPKGEGAISNLISGKLSLTKLSNEILPFGGNIVKYSETVTGKIDNGAITSSINAAKALAGLIESLPTDQGMLSNIASGKLTLSKITSEILPFGNGITAYSKIVSGNIDVNAVQSSVNAGKILTGLIESLPEGFGVLDKVISGQMSLSQLASQIIPFGSAIAEYSSIVSGKVDEAAVTASVNAGTVLNGLASSLPSGASGLAAFFSGQMSLSQLASQIIPFGSAIAEYSSIVSGKVDEDAVIASANAGQALSGLINALPSGSVNIISWFSGKLSLSQLASQIIPFGSAIAQYSSIVSGKINESAVQSSVNAGLTLSGLINSLPPASDSLISWFAGKMTLSQFASQIIPFGSAIAEYSSIVSGKVDEAAVIASANCGKVMSQLVNSLPSSGGVLELLFGGKMSMSKFGSELVSFGSSIASFSETVKGKGIENLGPAISEIQKLVNVAKGLESVDTSKFGGFAKGLQELAKISVDSFIKTFDNASGKVRQSAVKMIDTFVTAVSENTSKVNEAFNKIGTEANNVLVTKSYMFSNTGKDAIDKYVSGINAQKSKATLTFSNFAAACADALKGKQTAFTTAGNNAVNWFVSGITSNLNKATTAGASLVNAALSGVNSNLNGFQSSGSQIVNGLVDGINKNIAKAEQAAKTLAQKTNTATNKTLGVKSPSREFMKTGFFCVEGLVIGLKNNMEHAKETASEVGSAIIFSVEDALDSQFTNVLATLYELLDDGIDFDPIITPILDTSNIDKGLENINSALNKSTAIAFTTNAAIENNRMFDQEQRSDGKSSNTYNFTQNNYSPKALSRTDIYRQTRNQFSQFREAMNYS